MHGQLSLSSHICACPVSYVNALCKGCNHSPNIIQRLHTRVVHACMGYRRIAPDIYAKLKAVSDDNKSVRVLAAELGISKSTVQRFRSAPSKPVAKAKPGRPRKTFPAQRKALKRKVERSGGGSRKLAEWNNQQGYPKISKGTVAAVLKGGRGPEDYLPVVRGRVLSEKNREVRLKFAKKHLKDKWDSTVFLDMKTVFMGYDEAAGYDMRWQKRGSKKVFKKQANPKGFNFYAAVAMNHKSNLIMVPMKEKGKGRGKLSFTSASFIEVMKQLFGVVEKWYPAGTKFRVVMDNAKQHVSEQSKSAMAVMKVPIMQDFPAQSYDMNLIEVAWGHLQQQLQGHKYKKRQTYEQGLRQAWGRVKQSTINALVVKHNQQMKEIIKNKGNWVKYKSS